MVSLAELSREEGSISFSGVCGEILLWEGGEAFVVLKSTLNVCLGLRHKHCLECFTFQDMCLIEKIRLVGFNFITLYLEIYIISLIFY